MVLLKLAIPNKVNRVMRKKLEEMKEDLSGGFSDITEGLIKEANDRRNS